MTRPLLLAATLLLAALVAPATAWAPGTSVSRRVGVSGPTGADAAAGLGRRSSSRRFVTTKEKPVSAEETTEKYGLEAGLFQSLQQPDGGASAKDLLKKYGVAYLATSIPLALLSFGVCYLLVDRGVDVAALLGRVGIDGVGATGEQAGTVALAYAAHKAASPLRFPPTVLLTPVVAKLLGREPSSDDGTAADE